MCCQTVVGVTLAPEAGFAHRVPLCCHFAPGSDGPPTWQTNKINPLLLSTVGGTQQEGCDKNASSSTLVGIAAPLPTLADGIPVVGPALGPDLSTGGLT